MATIKQFEDLDDWQRPRALAKAIYSTSSAGEFSGISVSRIKFDGRPSPQWEILRQALNVMAKGSRGEVHAQLFLALDQAYIGKDEFRSFFQNAVRLRESAWHRRNYRIDTFARRPCGSTLRSASCPRMPKQVRAGSIGEDESW